MSLHSMPTRAMEAPGSRAGAPDNASALLPVVWDRHRKLGANICTMCSLTAHRYRVMWSRHRAAKRGRSGLAPGAGGAGRGRLQRQHMPRDEGSGCPHKELITLGAVAGPMNPRMYRGGGLCHPESRTASQMASRARIWTSSELGMSVQSRTRACASTPGVLLRVMLNVQGISMHARQPTPREKLHVDQQMGGTPRDAGNRTWRAPMEQCRVCGSAGAVGTFWTWLQAGWGSSPPRRRRSARATAGAASRLPRGTPRRGHPRRAAAASPGAAPPSAPAPCATLLWRRR